MSAPLRPWVKACVALMILTAITLVAQGAFYLTMPDKVLDEYGRAATKAARDAEARHRFVPPARMLSAGVDPYEVAGLPSDAAIDHEYADPDFASHQREVNQSNLRSLALNKGIGGVILLVCGLLVVRRHFSIAGW